MWKNERDTPTPCVADDGNNIIRETEGEGRKRESMQFFTLNEKLLDRLPHSQRAEERREFVVL